jgi:S-DNA-T family DNA segregation ATPase FtsK/SpoIIIE
VRPRPRPEADRRNEYIGEHSIPKLGEDHLDRFPLEVIVMDEFQLYSDDERVAKRVVTLSGYAAALNIVLVVVTQDPDVHTVPSKYKKNSGLRVATKTASAAQTNAILNDGATGSGMVAHDIPISIPGLSIVDADGAEQTMIRSFFIEDEKYDGAAPLISTAVGIRRAAKRLPGQFDDPIEAHLAALFGDSSATGGPRGNGTPGAVPTGILADLLAAFAARPKADRLATADVLAALAQIRPDVWSPAALGDPADYNRAGGALLAKKVGEALDNTPRSLKATQWTEADEARGGRRTVTGYRLDHVRAAAGLS